jgi:hypothetical protein
MRGAGRGVGAIIALLIETPWLAYAFLLATVSCLLFFLLDHKKIKHPVPIILAACIVVVSIFRNAQGHGWEYATIWVFGIIGCAAYGIDRLIREGITRY